MNLDPGRAVGVDVNLIAEERRAAAVADHQVVVIGGQVAQREVLAKGGVAVHAVVGIAVGRPPEARIGGRDHVQRGAVQRVAVDVRDPPGQRAIAPVRPHPQLRVARRVVTGRVPDAHLQVQVRAERDAGRADSPDLVALGDLLPGLDIDLREVPVERKDRLAGIGREEVVLDHDHVAVEVRDRPEERGHVVPGVDHRPILHGDDRRP